MTSIAGCAGGPDSSTTGDYGLLGTASVTVTSESGHKMAELANARFSYGTGSGVVVNVDPESRRQVLSGVGTSFTESSAFVLAHLPVDKRREVMERIYGEQGANFSMARTHVASTDFSVLGKYAYANDPDDKALQSFSIDVDRAGFSRDTWPGIVDESYDLLPMIHEALAIKAGQADSDLRIIASAWTAPPWMKTIDDWYIRPGPHNDWQGTGGELKPGYESVYADYLIRYLEAYRDEGINIWGLTPVNEPNGNSGQWESMHFTPQTQNVFVREHLGPELRQRGFGDVRLLIYDQNRDHLEEWTDVLFEDPQTAQYVYGAAVHWYSSTTNVYEDVFERVNARYPNFSIIHTEGTIDDLGKDAPDGVLDPERFKESGWFANDDFWWNATATDWAYSATWAPEMENHPIYVPVHRYARDIVVGFNHWLEGWVDWNIVLDARGGPNHVGNFCGAPIMIDTDTGEVYYTPIFHVLAQISRSVRPGDIAVETSRSLGSLGEDDLHASASLNNQGMVSVQLLNTRSEPLEMSLQIGGQFAPITLEGNSLSTVQVQLDAGSR